MDRRRRPSHYADFHRVKKRAELDVYYTALRQAEHRANLGHEYERLNSLSHQARDDPEMVVRLVTRAKDKTGKDLYTRRENDKSSYLW